MRVEKIASDFNVTTATIRSDLRFLEAQGFITRFHGGAIINPVLMKEEMTSSKQQNITQLIRNLTSGNEVTMDKQHKGVPTGKVCVLGSFNIDIVARVKRFPEKGETIVAIENTLGPGGKGCNQALAVHCSDAHVHFVAKVGTDHFSQYASDHFISSGLTSYTLYKTEEHGTGSAVIFVSEEDGENVIAISPGANKTLTENEINDAASELEDSNVLLLQLENNIEAIAQMMTLAKEKGCKIILNPAPYTKEIKPFLAMVDIITPNRTEATQLSGIDVNDLPSAKQAASIISSWGIDIVIITMGSEGVLLLQNNTFTHIPAYPAVVTDTTGAGDAFNGAVAAALANGKDVLNAVKYAAAFASLAVEREGAANMPTQEAALYRMGEM